ncbi:MAG: cytochrome d ubiquinol oxidase subunit II [Campylobacteraceae bacterium]|nr:cytochrome d ubiquinol oxidase subunit II [Campylobacteraceae bacterium]
MYELLQIYWWAIISLLGGLLVFMMFVQGGQTLLKCVAETELDKDMIINSIGKKWELTFTTLVMFGGACFAAFPLFYATSFGGAYWLWLAILFCFVIQAVSFEYRKKPDNFLGQKTYEWFLFINGSLGVILIGIAVSTFFSGSSFLLNSSNFVEWQHSLRGLEAFKNPFNYVLGLALFFQARVGGNLYLLNHVDDDRLRSKFRRSLKINAAIFIPFLLAFLLAITLKDGYHITENGTIIMKEYKYLINLIEMPIVLAMLLVGLLLALFGVFKGAFTPSIKGIFSYGLGVVLVVMSVFLVVGLNNTAFYPSHYDLQSSLTIYNASSSPYTLKVMAYVSLWAPFVLGYIAYVWRAMDRRKLTVEEVESDEHIY